VQKSISKAKSSGESKKEKQLKVRYNRVARAKLGTFTKIGWMQLDADNAKGQRNEVTSVVREINKKVCNYPTAPVSDVGVLEL
jgi:hypothetical protein